MGNHTITISTADRERLETLIEYARHDPRVREKDLAALEGELGRARVVHPDRVPPDAIAMNSVVRLRDLDTDETETYTLVYPQDADVLQQRISVFAPVGTALLGYRKGDVIEWIVPAGLRRLKVEEVLSQPEYASVHR
jgi:regulator of nucleoside diphosphate kinase